MKSIETRAISALCDNAAEPWNPKDDAGYGEPRARNPYARPAGRPAHPFKCVSCGRIMSKAAVRTHKCPLLG